jgi:undecaprenyl-diphosphatase
MKLNLSIAATLLTAIIYTLVVLRVDVFSLDLKFTNLVQENSLEHLSFLSGVIFWMGIRGVAGLLMVIISLIFWLKRYRIEAIFLLAVMIPNLANMVIKHIIGRPRPTNEVVDVLIGYGGIQGYSFPSGHAVHLVLFYGFLIFLAWRMLENRNVVRVLCPIGLVYILLSGLWLVHDGRHWITDVIGGYIFGVFYLLIFIKAYIFIKARY